MSLASWSLALKSAAVSVANAVGAKGGCPPPVATSWPDRSTSSAQRALLSKRNFWSEVGIAPKSSSVKDQLAAPTAMPTPSFPLPSRRPRLGDGDAVRVLQVAPDGNAARDARNRDAERRQLLLKIQCRGLAFELEARGHDDPLHAPAPPPPPGPPPPRRVRDPRRDTLPPARSRRCRSPPPPRR